jgi:hypothetical protein
MELMIEGRQPSSINCLRAPHWRIAVEENFVKGQIFTESRPRYQFHRNALIYRTFSAVLVALPATNYDGST